MTAFLLSALLYQQGGVPKEPPYKPSGPKIRFELSSGKAFVITTDPRSSPKTVAHVLDLVRKKFYDRIRFHRVESWVMQWGDPQSKVKPLSDPKMGEGDTGFKLKFERSDVDFRRGVVGVASEGLQLGGDCQLFAIKKDTLRLWRSYAVVGRVSEGMSIIDGVRRGDRIRSARVIP